MILLIISYLLSLSFLLFWFLAIADQGFTLPFMIEVDQFQPTSYVKTHSFNDNSALATAKALANRFSA